MNIADLDRLILTPQWGRWLSPRGIVFHGPPEFPLGPWRLQILHRGAAPPEATLIAAGGKYGREALELETGQLILAELGKEPVASYLFEVGLQVGNGLQPYAVARGRREKVDPQGPDRLIGWGFSLDG